MLHEVVEVTHSKLKLEPATFQEGMKAQCYVLVVIDRICYVRRDALDTVVQSCRVVVQVQAWSDRNYVYKKPAALGVCTFQSSLVILDTFWIFM